MLKEKNIYKEDLPVNVVVAHLEEYPIHFHDDMEVVYVLEGTSVNLATPMAQLIQQKLALPEQAMSYLYSHGSLDQEHIQFFRTLMEKLDDPADQAAVIHMAKVMFQLYGNVFRSLPMDEISAVMDEEKGVQRGH